MTYPTQQRVSGQNVGKIKISISIVAADEYMRTDQLLAGRHFSLLSDLLFFFVSKVKMSQWPWQPRSTQLPPFHYFFHSSKLILVVH